MPPPEATRARAQSLLPGLNGPVLLALYGALALAPMGLALLSGRTPGGFWHELASGLAMTGYAMLLLEFPLSGRFRGVSGKVGIDVTMRVHQFAAWGLLLFLLLHPLLYAAPRLGADPARALTMLERIFTAEWNRSGVIAWLLLLMLVPVAWLRERLPFGHEAWRATHGVGAALVAGFGLHHALSVSRHDTAWLPVFWIVLAAMALATLLFVYAVKPLLQLRRPYHVIANRQIAERTWELRLSPQHDRQIHFLAGQFAWLNLGHSPFSLTEHPFSISSAPAESPEIGFTIKQSGDFTNRIGTVPPGTLAWLDGPHGHFVVPPGRHERLVFIAGGVGFAPVISILRQLRAESYADPVTLIYGNRVETQILYREELEAMAREIPLELRFVLAEPPPGWRGAVGQLTPDVLAGLLDAPRRAHWQYFVCGPPPMMNSVEHGLRAFGVPARQIVAEHFQYA